MSTTRNDQDADDALDGLADQVEKLDLKENDEGKTPELHPDVEGASDELKRVAKWIQSANNVVVLSGAGVSVSAGIPDFRTPGTGLYDNLQAYNLPFPEAVFDLGFYQSNPQPFCRLAQEIWPGITHSPTKTHSFLKVLSDKKKLLRNYTQNIDGLEHLAGIPQEEILECHGHFRTASCTECGKAMDGEDCKRIILEKQEAPKCLKKRCGGYVKPDIVFFGEGLPDRFHKLLRVDMLMADLLIVVGTSLMVAPVSMIPDMVQPDCKRVLLNREKVGDFVGERDCFEGGDCDDSLIVLAKLLGWEDELHARHKEVQLGSKDKAK
mmetsp:Transcript_5114/g.7123  ORF Transcript_5114/g.7123 Transcript_5114/m.7123 type:complete len:323 (-) Transcript_5114:141-1109(-)|eukprot:CAMPEP_0194028834 /NCGR_PEP_ID=MMETSP0009_2-20130614/2715_1 /TAXON_ID=210454 /ORGANISM="Grammatophora oceanica, Strain CCMP 410" /LENGTH=322 /DNA_ID=CAMNT_0038668339 /DNA_START=176 /DNA_END=1144 /DNA_ORIENTATION=-